MNDWSTQMRDRVLEASRQAPARAPATLGEIWDTEWKAAGLDTTFGVHKPMNDAYLELLERTEQVAGQGVFELARSRNLDFVGETIDKKIAALGQIVDSLPDPQQKLLEDYKDVRGRARAKAAEIERQSADVAGATYGLSGYATAFTAGVARQMADPVNLATAPIGGPAKGPVLKWLGKEFLIGAGVQAAQEPFIASTRQQLGLETNSLENILEAGVGQAGIAGVLRGAAAAWRAGRRAWNGPQVDLSPADIEAVARKIETEDLVGRQTGPSREAAEALERATAVLNGQAPIAAATATRSGGFSLDGPQRVVVNDELAFNVRYAVVERKDLIVSHDADGAVNKAFPAEIQPRDRSTPEMRTQLQDIAGKLEPTWLTVSANAQFGAPIVSDRGIVESGNGRTLSIGLAYERFPDRATAYRDELERLGFDTSAFERPVLVRIRQDDLSAEQLMAYTARSNVSEVAKLSVAEQASLDARNLHGGILESYQGGDLSLGRNADFVRRFIQELVPVADQNAFIAGGRPTEAGIARMQGALLARAWQDPRMVREIAENPNPTSITILRAFADSAPQVSRLRAAIEESRVDAGADIIQPLKSAFDLVERARIEGRKLTMLVDQADVETGAVSDAVRSAVRLFFRNDELTVPAGRETIEQRIRDAVDRAIMSQAGGLFGEVVEPAAILRAARFATEPFDELSPTDRARLLSDAAAGRDVAAGRLDAEAARPQQDAPAEAGQLLEGTPPTQPNNILAMPGAKPTDEFLGRNSEGNPVFRTEAGKLAVLENGTRAIYEPSAAQLWSLETGRPVEGTMPERYRVTEPAPAQADQPAAPRAPDGQLLEARAQTPAQVIEFNQAKFEQPFTDLDTLFGLAPSAQKELIEALESARIGEVKDPGLKARDGDRGVEAKIERKGYDDIRQVTDVARGGVIIKSPGDADIVIDALKQKFTVWDEGWKLSDVGYSDRKIMVRTSNGLLAEVQILEETFAAAKKPGHKLYEEREAARLAGQTDRAKQIMAEEKQYWSEIQAALPPDWRAALGLPPNASSSAPNAASAKASSMTRPSSPISPEDTGNQPRLGDKTNPSSVSSSTTANRPSQLKSLNDASDIGASDLRVAQGDAEINARVKAVVNEIGEDTRLPFEQPDGTMKELTVRERLAEIDKSERAAVELNDCIARNGGGSS